MNLAKIHTELDRLFDIFNKKYFENYLEKPMIIIQSTGKKPINGYCTTDKAWTKITEEGIELYEIGISAEHLARDVYGLCGTLLHEMTHLLNLKLEVKDVAENYVYHNKKFKIEAEKHGLIITKVPKAGWSYTELNDECKEFVDTLQIDPELFSYARLVLDRPKKENKYKLRKYVCPECGEVIYSRNKEGLTALCGICSLTSDENGNVDELDEVYFQEAVDE